MRFLDLARLVASWSKDPSTQTGAVIVDPNHRIVSVGYNGFPKGVADDDRLHYRDMKYEMIVHCEVNAVLFARQSVLGMTLYTVPFLSCSRCAVVMIQAGIWRVVAPNYMPERWKESFELSKALFEEAGVEVRLV